jgi:hypothetical protein
MIEMVPVMVEVVEKDVLQSRLDCFYLENHRYSFPCLCMIMRSPSNFSSIQNNLFFMSLGTSPGKAFLDFIGAVA